MLDPEHVSDMVQVVSIIRRGYRKNPAATGISPPVQDPG